MAFISAPAPMELIVILGIALLVLGPSRLPEAARSMGRGLRELRQALRTGSDEDEDEDLYDEAEPDRLPERG